jgi:formylglycine-generating enzyme required for sulfatase activity
MKKLVLILLINLTISNAFGQEWVIITSVNKHVDIVSDNEFYGVTYDKILKIPMMYNNIEVINEMIYLSMDTVSGMANLKCEIVIPVQYDGIEKFDKSSFIAYKGNLHFYYNDKGVLLKNKFDFVQKVNKHLSVVMLNDQYGLTFDGEIKVPVNYVEYDVSGDLIYLFGYKDNVIRDNISAGVANENGEIIIPVEYDGIEENEDVVFVNKKGKYGAFDRHGKLIVPVEFNTVEFYRNCLLGTAPQKFALYKHDGTVLIPISEKQIRILDENGEVYAIQENNEFKVFIPQSKEILKGYVQVSDKLFSKNTEVSILDYFAFLAHQKENNYLLNKDASAEIPITDLLPDTAQIEKKLLPVYLNFLNQIVKEERTSVIDYHLTKNTDFKIEIPFEEDESIEKMLNFPITGITHEQATLYTKWLTMLYAEIVSDNDYGYFVNYRLPSEQEWITMAESGLKENMKPNHVLDSVNAENCMLYIYDNLPKCKGYDSYIKSSLGGGSVPVLSMNPDWNGVYQLFGNVSEFTALKGVNKGGSYYHSAKLAATNQFQNGEEPKPWLGFRVVAELVYFE